MLANHMSMIDKTEFFSEENLISLRKLSIFIETIRFFVSTQLVKNRCIRLI
jgi:hypothetical protein